MSIDDKAAFARLKMQVADLKEDVAKVAETDRGRLRALCGRRRPEPADGADLRAADEACRKPRKRERPGRLSAGPVDVGMWPRRAVVTLLRPDQRSKQPERQARVAISCSSGVRAALSYVSPWFSMTYAVGRPPAVSSSGEALDMMASPGLSQALQRASGRPGQRRNKQAHKARRAGNRIVGGAISRDPTGAKGGIGDEVKAPIGPVGDRSIPPKDDSGTIPTLRSLIAAMTRALRDPRSVGDVTVARLAARLLLHVLDVNSHDRT